MADREKVIRGLECCIETVEMCWDNPKCPYNGCEDMARGEDCMSLMMRDALSLLKAQEPVKPYGKYSEHTGTKWLACGACNQPMVKITPNTVYPNYCPECGRAVKWE